MSGIFARRRSRSTIENETDADATRYNGVSPPSDGAKRLRLRDGESEAESGDERDDNDDTVFHSMGENEQDGDGAADDASANGATHDDFKPGAIVRVRVDNFVTYEHAEFFPGPNLNMVIGPNGTGKSSLVCAICLGLGYNNNVLGRAGTYAEFVKHGKDTATVEVELQRRPRDRTNITVKLRINRENNSRKFWLNGKERAQKDIISMMRALRIQIDNLCQFLPQDKVAEFAGLTPIDLLTKTLQAAAPPEMMEHRKQLKEIYAKQADFQQQVNDDAEQLRVMESRQQGLQADVARLREREEIEARIAELESAKVVAAYNAARRTYAAAKDEKGKAKAALKQLEEDCGPSLQAVNQKQEYLQLIERAVGSRKETLKEAESAADEMAKEVTKLTDKIAQLESSRLQGSSRVKEKRKEIGDIRHKITNLEARTKSDRKAFVAAEWNTRIREKEHFQREIAEQKRLNQDKIDSSSALGRRVVANKSKVEEELAKLDSKEGQQMNQLRRNYKDAAQGLEWLKDHADDFEKEIFGPAMISCSVKDERYSSLIQAMLQEDDLVCFTTQSRADHKKLSDQLYRTMQLSVTVRTCMTPLAEFRSPVSREEASTMGLDGFAIDYLEGPAPVLAMLCAEKRLHGAGVALKEISDAQYEYIIKGAKVSSWAAGKETYRVNRRREYGPNAVSTSTKNVRPGRFWTDAPVDETVRRQLKQRRDEFGEQFEQLKSENRVLKAKDAGFLQRTEEVVKEIMQLRSEKNQLQDEHTKFLALPEKIEQAKKALVERHKELAEARQELFALDGKQDQLVLDRAKAVLRYVDRTAAIRDAYQAVLDVQIRVIEAHSDVDGLKAKNAETTRRLDEVKQSLATLSQSMKQIREDAKVLQDACQAFGDVEIQRLQLIVGDNTEEEVHNELEAEKAKLEFIRGVPAGVLREFQTRARDIERVKRQQADNDGQIQAANERIQSIREEWEPKLDALVSRIDNAFSYNFEQISCAGEVNIHKDEDFEKWAIEIKVRFRENETLQRLDQHRQSGGERAVSTIFYLMSLQSMAQAPFRVVDEINQGMDPRNERMVHERMVEIACREHTSQYFLITPKLLSGLRYDERMRVLCIASGEHMPPGNLKLDFGKCLGIQKRLLAAAGA